MSSIRNRQGQTLPGYGQAPQGQAQFLSQQQNPNQRFYGPILSHGVNNAMLVLQNSIGNALVVPAGVMPMNKGECLALERISKCLVSLSDARKKCPGGSWSRSQQQWNGNAAQQADDEGAQGEAAIDQDQAGHSPYNQGANQTSRVGGFATAGAR